MSEIYVRPVVDLHLPPECPDAGFEEQLRLRGSGIGPDDVRDAVVVPGGGFGEETLIFGLRAYVGGYRGEALGGWVLCALSDSFEGCLELLRIARDDDDIGTALREESSDLQAHALGTACEEDCLRI